MIQISKPFLGKEEIKAVEDVLISGMIAQGPKVQQFEELFANFCSAKYAVAVNSGTAALHTALHSIGIKQGDEIITTPFTFIATANSILMQTAKPVFADVEEDTFNINPDKIQEKITKKTKAIITVDLFGHLCDYKAINEIAEEQKLIVVEDAAQAVNAEFNNKKSGSFGSIATFSFYATKNITSGEGGIITTNNKAYAESAKLFRQHGRSNISAYDYEELGFNYRMTDISAAILLEQLKKLDFITKKRIENAEYLSKHLQDIKEIKVPTIKKDYKHAFHQYTIKIEDNFKLTRDKLAEYLNKKGIGCAVYYPKPLHLCKNFVEFGYKAGDFPVAEKLSTQVLSLPVHPSLTKEELDYVINTIKNI